MKFFLLTAALLASLISPNAFGEGMSRLQSYGLNASAMQSTEMSSLESKQMIVPMINWSDGEKYIPQLAVHNKMDRIGDWFGLMLSSLMLCIMAGCGGFIANMSYLEYVDEPSVWKVTMGILGLVVVVGVGSLTTFIHPLHLVTANPWLVPLLLESILVGALIGARLAQYLKSESETEAEQANLA